jgi:hypothetical protein
MSRHSYVLSQPTGLPQVMPIMTKEEIRWSILQGMMEEYKGVDALLAVSEWNEWEETLKTVADYTATHPYKAGWIHLFGFPPIDHETIIDAISKRGITVTEDLTFSPPRSPPVASSPLSPGFLEPSVQRRRRGRHFNLK